MAISMKTMFLLLATLLSLFVFSASASRFKMVAYWGQNGVHNKRVIPKQRESSLTHFCQNSKYDVIVLCFMHIFFDQRNKHQMPGLNFAYHCEKPVSQEYPSLLKCNNIATAIKTCHQNGKTVLMSLGGASGNYGFSSQGQATLFASRVWNLLLGGKSMPGLRPFGNVVLDGVDLDIEGGSPMYYTEFVRSLRGLMQTDHARKYTIAAAPQCPFPDAYLGPASGRALGDVPQMFDEIYIQFYNNYCHAGDPAAFWPNIANWISSFTSNDGPSIIVGLPGDSNGASNNPANFQSLAQLKVIFNRLKTNPSFGGFMLWDAGFDEHNKINGRPYSDHIVEMMSTNVKTTTSARPQTTIKATHKPTSKPNIRHTPPSPKVPLKATPPLLPRKTVSCKGIPAGYHGHPLNCSKFIVCSRGIAYIKRCPHGLKWNSRSKTCDWSRNVHC